MITGLIFDWARRTPDKTAVIYNGQPWSYRSFAQCIAAARGYFARRDCLGPGHAVLAVNSLMDFWILGLALRSQGLTTVSVPSAAAMDELGMLDIRCVVTNPAEAWPGLDSLCAARGLRLLHILPDGESAAEFNTSAEPGGHILRTSGTTGTYKMVLMSPDLEPVLMRSVAEAFCLNQDSVFCVFNFPPWTGVGYKVAVCTWSVGGSIVIEQGLEGHRALVHPGITHAVLIPAMLTAILSAPADAFPRNDAMQLIVGGGTMTHTLIERAKARITPHLFNSFASTECGVVSVTPLDTPEDQRWHRILPGRAVEVVDDSDRPVPAGEIGRLRVGIDGGPTGYLHNETATQAFFKDGFFYPGDLAVIRSDGRMALQGRLTDVINVRGHKVSPAPIEDRLKEIFDVSGVCLLSMQDENGEEEVHVVFESSTPMESERLVSVVRQELRGFPRARIHYVAVLSRNEMGKVLRQEVRAQVVAGQLPFAHTNQLSKARV